MPELPEAEVVRCGAQNWFAGRTIASGTVADPRILKPSGCHPENFVDALVGSTIQAAHRRGKYLWFRLSSAECVVVHLGMTGQIRVDTTNTPVRHERVRLRFADDGPDFCYADQRLFGYLHHTELVPAPDAGPDGVFEDQPGLIPQTITHIARDLFDASCNHEQIVATIVQKKSGIKRILLDQRVVAGIGNIYADEALWRARLHHDRPGVSISARKVRELIGHARDVMTESLAQGGTSFDAMYVNINGASGYFSRSLNVYGQAGKACPRCGKAIIREKFMNRSAHRCPKCQPPRKR